MLRCTGCSELVSEYAARCPLCGTDLSEAEYVDPDPPTTDRQSEPARTPAGGASEREPSGYRRVLLISAGAAILALLICTPLILKVGATAGGKETPLTLPPEIHALPGRVVAQARDGRLLISRADGSHQTPLVRTTSETAGNKVLLNVDGSVLSVSGTSFTDVLAGGDTLRPAATPVGADPFSDHGQAVVAGTGPAGAAYLRALYLVTISDHHTASLGLANAAAADPLSLGAFVSVPAARQPTDVPPGGIPALADSRVELRDVGDRSVVLATAGQLDQDVHQQATKPVNLTLFPSPDGSKVAVALNPIGGGDSATALVILDRDGRVLGAVGGGAGPAEYTQVYWSPDDLSLSYATFDEGAPALAVLGPALTLHLQELQPGTTIDGCAWSADSRWVVCQATGGMLDNWVLTRNVGNLMPIYSYRAEGLPLAWLEDGST